MSARPRVRAPAVLRCCTTAPLHFCSLHVCTSGFLQPDLLHACSSAILKNMHFRNSALCIALYVIAFHCITLQYTTLHYITLQYTTQHYSAPYYTTPHCTTVHHTARESSHTTTYSLRGLTSHYHHISHYHTTLRGRTGGWRERWARCACSCASCATGARINVKRYA